MLDGLLSMGKVLVDMKKHGPMGVTHFLMLLKTASSLSLRVARTPQGPTLTFKIDQYSLASDIAQSQLRPRCPQDLFKSPPWAGYGSESKGDEEAATVTQSSDLGRVNRRSTKSAVKLQEIGPRITMQLVKVEEGLCSGGIIFSEYENGDGKKAKKKKKQDEVGGDEEDSEEEEGDEEGSEEDVEDMDEDYED